MKQLLILSVCFGILCFTSCDGKERALKIAHQNAEDSTLSKSFFESTEYFPKDYTESITDTLLTNGFRVKMLFASDMKDNLLREFKADTIHYKHYYREFNLKKVAHKNDSELLNQFIDKAYLIEQNQENKALLKDAIMHYAGIDQEASLLKNEAIIDIVYCKPETDDCLFSRRRTSN